MDLQNNEQNNRSEILFKEMREHRFDSIIPKFRKNDIESYQIELRNDKRKRKIANTTGHITQQLLIDKFQETLESFKYRLILFNNNHIDNVKSILMNPDKFDLEMEILIGYHFSSENKYLCYLNKTLNKYNEQSNHNNEFLQLQQEFVGFMQKIQGKIGRYQNDLKIDSELSFLIYEFQLTFLFHNCNDDYDLIHILHDFYLDNLQINKDVIGFTNFSRLLILTMNQQDYISLASIDTLNKSNQIMQHNIYFEEQAIELRIHKFKRMFDFQQGVIELQLQDEEIDKIMNNQANNYNSIMDKFIYNNHFKSNQQDFENDIKQLLNLIENYDSLYKYIRSNVTRVCFVLHQLENHLINQHLCLQFVIKVNVYFENLFKSAIIRKIISEDEMDLFKEQLKFQYELIGKIIIDKNSIFISEFNETLKQDEFLLSSIQALNKITITYDKPQKRIIDLQLDLCTSFCQIIDLRIIISQLMNKYPIDNNKTQQSMQYLGMAQLEAIYNNRWNIEDQFDDFLNGLFALMKRINNFQQENSVKNHDTLKMQLNQFESQLLRIMINDNLSEFVD